MNRVVLVVLAFGCLAPRTALAQASIGALGYITYGQTSLTASNTFETIGGESKQTGLAGGGTVTGLWKGLFVDVALSQQKIAGERVFLDANTVYRLGIPLSITIRPIDVATGWRLHRGRMSPYVGGGVSFVSYKERDTFAEAIDQVNEQATGGLVLGGVDVAVLRWLHVGAEVRHRFVSGVLGDAGVSEARGDNQVGGTAIAARVGIGR